MRSGAFPLLPWGAGLVCTALVGRLVFDLEWLPFLLLLGAALSALTWGAVTGVIGRDGRRPFADEDPRVVVDSSWSVVGLCVGVVIALSGWLSFGSAFIGLGGVLMAFAVGGLVREARAERRALRHVGQRP